MAAIEVSEEFIGSIETVFAAISKYELYPKYLPGVTAITVLPAALQNSTCLVRYELNVVKTFFYELNMFAEPPRRIWWNLHNSNLMKANDGGWDFEPSGNDKTRATYSLEIKFKGLVPSIITDQVAKANLPLMMRGFQRLITENP